ncbi:protein of unknown function [Moritella yayanosii]|uniref:Uncharacterized protein n=1 Tax=Moritella yayanosii TaxID=69539 RepID=A0A330LMB0_9GAMM|nr:protein of unknown function [Moritella yayanosii]
MYRPWVCYCRSKRCVDSEGDILVVFLNISIYAFVWYKHVVKQDRES